MKILRTDMGRLTELVPVACRDCLEYDGYESILEGGSYCGQGDYSNVAKCKLGKHTNYFMNYNQYMGTRYANTDKQFKCAEFKFALTRAIA